MNSENKVTKLFIDQRFVKINKKFKYMTYY